MERKTIKQFIVFGIVGGIATVIDFLFFNIAFWLTSFFVFSRVIGIVLSMIWNFNANRYITFKAKEGNPTKQLIKYLIVYGIAMGANVLIGWIAFQMLGPGQLNANIAAALGLVVSIPTAFIGSKLWAFKIEKNKTPKNLNRK